MPIVSVESNLVSGSYLSNAFERTTVLQILARCSDAMFLVRSPFHPLFLKVLIDSCTTVIPPEFRIGLREVASCLESEQSNTSDRTTLPLILDTLLRRKVFRCVVVYERRILAVGRRGPGLRLGRCGLKDGKEVHVQTRRAFCDI
jgi:hypothetical protein